MKLTFQPRIVMMALVAMFVCMPLTSWAATFISEVKISVSSIQSTAKNNLSGYTLIDKDLNEKGGGRYVYLGYKTTTNPAEAITGLLVVVGDEFCKTDYLSSSISYNGLAYYRCPAAGTSKTDANLNSYRTGKTDITLFYTKGGVGSGHTPLTSLSATNSSTESGVNYVRRNDNGTLANTNDPDGGNTVYLTYTTHAHSFTLKEVLTEGTCTQYGRGNYICGCGYAYEDNTWVNPDNHSKSSDGTVCTNCKHTFWKYTTTDGNKLNVTGTIIKHTYESGEGVVESIPYYRISFENCTTLSAVTIPYVKTIGLSTFQDCTSLSSINIPSSVTIIDASAFQGCTSLSSINIPSSVTSIGMSAFQGCTSLSSINIPSSVTSIGMSIFKGCTLLSNCRIEGNVQNIESDAFRDCSALSIFTIPKSVTSVGANAFNGCTAMTMCYIDTYSSLETIGESAFRDCSAMKSISIPISVKTIGESAFQGCKRMTSAYGNFTNSKLTSIGNKAFRDCAKLKTFKIPSTVTSLGTEVFYGCASLTDTSLPNGVTSIGSEMYRGCTSLTNITIPSSVTSIAATAFSDTPSLNVKLASGRTSINEGLFRGCSSLISISIPTSVTSIGESAFYGCTSLSSISIPSGVTSIGRFAFSGCSSLTSISIPSGVTSIMGNTFKGCSSLTSFSIPSSVTSIGTNAFRGCSSLTSISIPSSVTSIGSGAFFLCNGKLVIESYATTPPTAEEGAIPSCTIYVPYASLQAYREADGWNNSRDIVPFGDLNANGQYDAADMARFIDALMKGEKRAALDIDGTEGVDTYDLEWLRDKILEK